MHLKMKWVSVYLCQMRHQRGLFRLRFSEKIFNERLKHFAAKTICRNFKPYVSFIWPNTNASCWYSNVFKCVKKMKTSEISNGFIIFTSPLTNECDTHCPNDHICSWCHTKFWDSWKSFRIVFKWNYRY